MQLGQVMILAALQLTIVSAELPKHIKEFGKTDSPDVWQQQDQIDDHWNSDEALAGKKDSSNLELLDLDNRILHCPPGSAVQRETIHDETNHARINFITKTCIFSVIITTGLLANFFVLAVLQYLQRSPMRSATKAEIVAICGYLISLIPIYPIANSYAYTGQFGQYEVAKPYVTTFFQTCSDIMEFLMIWVFIWINKIDNKFMVPPNIPKGKNKEEAQRIAKENLDSYTSKSVRDELRLIVVLAVIIALPKYFDTNVKAESDPCNPGEIIVLREPNILGDSKAYILLYRLVAVGIAQYILPLVLLARYTYTTHKALRKSERPEGDSREKVRREKSRFKDGLTSELDWRIVFFYVLYLPHVFYSIAVHIEYILPTTNQRYFEVAAVSQLITRLLVTIHAAYVPIGCYLKLYKAFWDIAKDRYWDRFVNIYKQYKRKEQLEVDFHAFEERFDREMDEDEPMRSEEKIFAGKSQSAPEIKMV